MGHINYSLDSYLNNYLKTLSIATYLWDPRSISCEPRTPTRKPVNNHKRTFYQRLNDNLVR